ncbi:uncharacterized protein LOC115267785 [Aedes albopictus]|uniref:Secreted protein n=1 Tax=Aedes albopictus TaxID=7160 RepID=A0ABM1Y323_AEDAL
MNQLISLSIGALLLVALGLRPAAAEIDPDDSCIPGTVGSIKSNLMRTLIICYVYGCPEELTSQIAANFNQFHRYDLRDEDDDDDSGNSTSSSSGGGGGGNGTSTDDEKEVPTRILTKLAKLTSALEKDRTAALTACTDFVSLLNKLIVDILDINDKCFLEPQAKYPPDSADEGSIDCDEMTVYMKQLKKYYGGQCDSKGKNCPEKLKSAVSWFSRAYKQLGKSCYYDAYEYLDK